MEKVRYERNGAVARIVLDNPPVNVLTLEVLDALLAAFRRAADDDEARAVVLSSANPKIFSAGIDLKAMVESEGQTARPTLEKLYLALWDAQHNLGKPSVAAVRGAARGGGLTVAISCDVIVASKGASFGYPEIDLGLLPAIHFVHLPRVIGRHRAFELLFSARTFTAQEAADLGLVSRIARDDEAAIDDALDLARVFAAKPPAAMRAARAQFMRQNDRDYRSAIAEVVDPFCEAAAGDEAQSHIAAFLDRGRR